jgi:beta-N-acetylhexosaminidase
VHASSVWLRIGGIAVAGAAVIACATSANAGGAPTTRHRSQHPGGATGGSGSAGATSATSPVAGDPVASSSPPARYVATGPAATLPTLSRAQLAGQRIIYSYSGHTVPGRLLWLIRHGQAAGVIFFGPNIVSKTQIAGVIKQLDAANAAKTNPVRAPLLLMTDQEGGLVRRLPGRPDLSEKQIGQSRHPQAAATTAGTGAAANLRSVGMNLNLAPVLDVFRTPGDFDDQFQRSYSSNPRVVSALGAAFVRAQQKHGVAATVKHFPGLGAAARNQNTDAGPVTLHVTKTNLRNIDEFPYKAAIAAKVKLVMASWAVYPALDSRRPAGLSSTIVQGELRKRLHFTGVTITDALEAGALRAFGGTANRSVLASRAGMDLLLCSARQVAQGVAARNALQAALRSGSLGLTAFKAAATRILNLRASLPK